MPLLVECNQPGCRTLTIGSRCSKHAWPALPRSAFPRGRPYLSQGARLSPDRRGQNLLAPSAGHH